MNENNGKLTQIDENSTKKPPGLKKPQLGRKDSVIQKNPAVDDPSVW